MNAPPSPTPANELGLPSASKPAPQTETLAPLVLLAGWALVTVLELATSVHPWISWVLTALEVLGVPAMAWVVVALAREDAKAGDHQMVPGARRQHVRLSEKEARRGRVRTYLLLGVLVILLGTLLWGQIQLLLAAHRGALTRGEVGASYRSYVVAVFALVLLGLLGSPRRLSRLLASVADHPARLMAGSFGLAALLGGLLLALPVSLVRVHDASLIHALFTSVSAVCVTGLSVYNVAETYSPFGQAVIFGLIQIGGIGIMSLSGFFAVLAGGRLRATHAVAMAELLDMDSMVSLKRTLIHIVAFTLAVEAAGALVLYGLFASHPEIAQAAAESSHGLAGAGSRLWAAVFHSVSAFCNAGFSVFRDGLLPLSSSWAVCATVMVLIVVGGLGFPVASELLRRLVNLLRRRRNPRLSLHARVVLTTTTLLILLGAAAFFVLEQGRAMGHLRWPERLLAALFQSISTRTAGFNTVDFGAMAPATLLVACFLMFVGASPGSTGGGVKTTTLAVLAATLRAELGRWAQPELGGRALGTATVRKAVAVTFMSVAIVATLLFVLLLSEEHAPAQIAFEVVSAFSTTGLSTGITSRLGVVGELAITVGMFVGRIGPLTLALAVATAARDRRYRLVEEHISIG